MLRIITKRPTLEYTGARQVSRLHTGFLLIVISWDLYLYVEEKLSQRCVKLNGDANDRS
jgi:hypothetical protein